MISYFLTALLLIDPLAATSNSGKVWFISDRPPGKRGPNYEISSLDSAESYKPYLQLQHRPVAIASTDRFVWFVDQGNGIGLYRMQWQEDEISTSSATLQAFVTTDLVPMDLEIIGDTVFVVCQNESLQCMSFEDDQRTLLPPLDSKHAYTTVFDDHLIAASQVGKTITVWTFLDGVWQESTEYDLEGKLTDIMVKDDWPILVMKRGSSLDIIGLQKNHQERVATLPIPKGRWRLIETKTGLGLLSVQRNGTVTQQEIGWPSGRIGKRVELSRSERTISTMEYISTLLIPLVLCLFLLMLIRKKK